MKILNVSEKTHATASHLAQLSHSAMWKVTEVAVDRALVEWERGQTGEQSTGHANEPVAGSGAMSLEIDALTAKCAQFRDENERLRRQLAVDGWIPATRDLIRGQIEQLQMIVDQLDTRQFGDRNEETGLK